MRINPLNNFNGTNVRFPQGNMDAGDLLHPPATPAPLVPIYGPRKQRPLPPTQNNGQNNTYMPTKLEDACFENGIYAQQFKSSARRASGEAEERTHVRDEGFSPEAQQSGSLKCDAYMPPLEEVPSNEE